MLVEVDCVLVRQMGGHLVYAGSGVSRGERVGHCSRHDETRRDETRRDGERTDGQWEAEQSRAGEVVEKGGVSTEIRGTTSDV